MALSLRMVFSFSVLVLLVFTMGCAAVGGISDPVELSNISAAVGVELKFTCEDNIQNGQEVDVDCGGDECPECKSGKRCLKDTDCVSGKCERPHMFSDRSCKSLEVDAEAAVRIALKFPERNWTNTTENQRPKVDDEVVEVEKTVGNATKDVENVKTSLHDLIVEGEEEEKKEIERDKRLNETFAKLTESIGSANEEKEDGGFGNGKGEMPGNGTMDSNVQSAKNVIDEIVSKEKKSREKNMETLKLMEKKINSLEGKINRTSKELKGVRKHSTEKTEALKTLGRERIKDEAVKEIEAQIKSGAKVDYESGNLENKDGDAVDTDLESKIDKLDEKSRQRVEKARQRAIEQAEDPAIMKTDLTLLLDVTIMLSFAALGGFAVKFLGLPITFGYIVGGLVVGPSTLSFVSNIAQVQTLSQFGSMFMIFGLGVEFPVEQVKRVRKIAIQGGGASILCVAFVFGTLLSFFARDFICSAMGPYLIGCGLAMSSTTVVLSHVKGLRISENTTDSVAAQPPDSRRDQGNPPEDNNAQFSLIRASADSLYGQITLGIIAVHEFWMALILSLPELLHSEDLMFSISRIVFGAAIAYMMIRVTPLNFINRMLLFVSKQDESIDLFKLGIVSFCLVFSLVTYSCGLSLELGAFISGYLLSRSPHRVKALAVVEPLKSLFSIIFFASMGMALNSKFLVKNIVFLVVSALLFIFIKATVIAAVLKFSFGVPTVTAFSTGVILGSVGELSLVFISKAARMSWKDSLAPMIGRRQYLLYLATTVVVLLLSPVIHKLMPHRLIALAEAKSSQPFFANLEQKSASSQQQTDIELAERKKHKERHSDNES